MDLLIVDTLEPEVRDWLGARHRLRCAPELALDPHLLRSALPSLRSMIVPASVAVDAVMLCHAPRLRAVGRIGAGVEQIDLEACTRAGVEVVRGPNATAQAEAEFVLGAMLSLFRRVPVLPGARGARAGRELGSSTVGLIGLSPAARFVSQMLTGFGSRVVGYDPAVHASDPVWRRWRMEPLALRELLERADAVCIQLADFTRYRGLLGERLLPWCKPEQVIVSIAHAGVFDLQALASALKSGRIAAAWLDSVEPGALDPGRPLAGIESLQVTPRVASTTRESRLRSAWEVARRIDHLLRQQDEPAHDGFMSTVPGEWLGSAGEPAWR